MGEHIPEWCMTSVYKTYNDFYNLHIEIAHRGYSSKHADNSKEAFNEAIIHKFDMIELDIQLCKNGWCLLLGMPHYDNWCSYTWPSG